MNVPHPSDVSGLSDKELLDIHEFCRVASIPAHLAGEVAAEMARRRLLPPNQFNENVQRHVKEIYELARGYVLEDAEAAEGEEIYTVIASHMALYSQLLAMLLQTSAVAKGHTLDEAYDVITTGADVVRKATVELAVTNLGEHYDDNGRRKPQTR